MGSPSRASCTGKALVLERTCASSPGELAEMWTTTRMGAGKLRGNFGRIFRKASIAPAEPPTTTSGAFDGRRCLPLGAPLPLFLALCFPFFVIPPSRKALQAHTTLYHEVPVSNRAKPDIPASN